MHTYRLSNNLIYGHAERSYSKPVNWLFGVSCGWLEPLKWSVVKMLIPLFQVTSCRTVRLDVAQPPWRVTRSPNSKYLEHNCVGDPIYYKLYWGPKWTWNQSVEAEVMWPPWREGNPSQRTAHDVEHKTYPLEPHRLNTVLCRLTQPILVFSRKFCGPLVQSLGEKKHLKVV